ncbi:MAG: hypothetical protein ACRD4Y_10420, partial [Candidatus Acidiferrales bacterium]
MHCNFAELCGNVTRAGALPGDFEMKREAAIRNRIIALSQAALLALFCVTPSPAAATDLQPEAARGYDRYIQLTEARMEPELAPGGQFLYVDGLTGMNRTDALERLARGEVVAARLRTSDSAGETRTPGALIHHWVGTIFIPGAKLADVLAVLQDYDRHDEYYKPEVVKSKTVGHSGDDFKIFYRLRRKKIITIVLDTNYDIHYHTIDSGRAYSDSHSTRIAQVEHPG